MSTAHVNGRCVHVQALMNVAHLHRPCRKKHCHAVLFQHGPQTRVACTVHLRTRPLLLFDRAISIFPKFSAALAADDVTSFYKAVIEAASSSNLFFFDTPINHCLLLLLMRSSVTVAMTSLVILMTRANRTGCVHGL